MNFIFAYIGAADYENKEAIINAYLHFYPSKHSEVYEILPNVIYN